MSGSDLSGRRLLGGACAGFGIAVCFAFAVRADGQSPRPAASQSPQRLELKRGGRLYVVAARDSRLFTLCSLPGGVAGPVVVVPGAGPSMTITRLSDSQAVHVLQTRESALLPLPPRDDPTTDRLLERNELDRDLLAWDAEIAVAITRELIKSGQFRVVESADDADYVLLAEAQHAAAASFSGAGATITQWRGDREANLLDAVFGIVVTAEEYRKHGPDAAALIGVSVWRGFALSRFEGQRGAGGPGRGRLQPASVESFVKRLRDREKWPDSYPALCAASDHPVAGGGSERPVFRRVDVTKPGTTEIRLPSSPITASSARPTFSTGVTYVSVPVTVRDADGNPVVGLKESDFHIYEDNAEQKIDRILTMSAGFNVGLLVDTSSSMRVQRNELQNAILAFIDGLRSNDRLMLTSFDDRVFVQAEFTADRSRLRRAVLQMRNGQATRLYDAIDLLVSRRLDAIAARKAMVLFTDGVDTRSRLATSDSTQLLTSESQVAVYVIQYDTRQEEYELPRVPSGAVPTTIPEGATDNTLLYMRAEAYLAAITNASGGHLYHAQTLRSLNDAFAQIGRELREQYTLCYYPTNQARDGTYRSVRVEVSRQSLLVRARAGYRAPWRLQQAW